MKFSRKYAIAIALIVIALFAFMAQKYYWYPIKNTDVSGDVIVAFGDSLTFGTGADRGQDWPSLVSRKCDCAIINKGVPGETTGEALRRLQSDVLTLHPRIVIVGLGGNDILQRLPRDKMFENLRRIVNQIQLSGAMVVLVGFNGFPLSSGLASGYSKVARETGSVYVPDILSGIISSPKLKSDQVHPNAAGYEIMADRIYDRLEPYL